MIVASRRLPLVFAIVGVLSLSSCAMNESKPRPSITMDDDFASAIGETCSSADSPLLSDFTSWEWDRVSIFNISDSPEFIAEEVGQPVLKEGFPYSDTELLVFQKDGKIVTLRSAIAGTHLITRTGRSFDNAVVLTPYSGDRVCPRVLTGQYAAIPNPVDPNEPNQ